MYNDRHENPANMQIVRLVRRLWANMKAMHFVLVSDMDVRLLP